jgi:hypothetical protein
MAPLLPLREAQMIKIAGNKPVAEGGSPTGLTCRDFAWFWPVFWAFLAQKSLPTGLSKIDNFADNSAGIRFLEKFAVYPGSIDRRRSVRSIGSVE